MRVRAAIAAAAAAVLAACGVTPPDGQPGSSPAPGVTRVAVHIRAATPAAAMDASGGCPSWTRRPWRDVANAWSGAIRQLVPPTLSPLSGVLCLFGTGRCGPCLVTPRTPVRIGLSATSATRLARVTAMIPLGTPQGAHGCGMTTHSFALIELSYAAMPPVVLYYLASGCRSLDNGHVRADQLQSPAFGQFQEVLHDLTHGQFY